MHGGDAVCDMDNRSRLTVLKTMCAIKSASFDRGLIVLRTAILIRFHGLCLAYVPVGGLHRSQLILPWQPWCYRQDVTRHVRMKEARHLCINPIPMLR